MLVSILHRITGNGLAVLGLAMLLWWLGALASGPDAYASFQGWVWADIAALKFAGGDFVPAVIKVFFRVVLIGLSWAFFTHLCSGLRHFVMDIGAGYELKANRLWSVLSPIIAILLTAAFWAAIILL